MSDAATPPLDLGLVSDAAAAVALGVTKRTLHRWRSLGTGPNYIVLGRKIVYRQQALLDHIASQERTPGPQGAVR